MENHKTSYKNNNCKISGSAYNHKFELSDGSYSASKLF